MAVDRIQAGLIAFCAGESATDEVLAVARELVRARAGPDVAGSQPPACGLPIGWATGPTAVDGRRSLIGVAVGTPGDDGRAAAAAQAVAAMASYAVARAPVFSVMAAGIEEAGAYGRGELTNAAVGSWRPPHEDGAGDPLPTVAAVIAALRAGEGAPAGVMRAGGELGGAAVSALAVAIAASRGETLDGIDPDGADRAELARLAEGLSALRE